MVEQERQERAHTAVEHHIAFRELLLDLHRHLTQKGSLCGRVKVEGVRRDAGRRTQRRRSSIGYALALTHVERVRSGLAGPALS